MFIVLQVSLCSHVNPTLTKHPFGCVVFEVAPLGRFFKGNPKGKPKPKRRATQLIFVSTQGFPPAKPRVASEAVLGLHGGPHPRGAGAGRCWGFGAGWGYLLLFIVFPLFPVFHCFSMSLPVVPSVSVFLSSSFSVSVCVFRLRSFGMFGLERVGWRVEWALCFGG